MHCGWYGCNMRTFLQCSAISLVPTGHQHGSSMKCPFLVYYHIVNQFLKATAIHIKFQPKKVRQYREVVWGRLESFHALRLKNRGVFGVSSVCPRRQLDIICLAARRLKVCAWRRLIGRTWQDTTGHKQTNKQNVGGTSITFSLSFKGCKNGICYGNFGFEKPIRNIQNKWFSQLPNEYQVYRLIFLRYINA